MNLTLAAAAGLMLLAPAAMAAPLSISLEPAAGNPASPRMGDNLGFHTVIRNDGATAVDGLIAWISLVQVDPGNEQPVDLEDWSAHKAVTASSLKPGGRLEVDWPMRLIQAGHYRVAVSAASRTGTELITSPIADIRVRQKPVVESNRVMPVAFGIPFLIGALLLWRHRRQNRGT
jgi:hypothetical protein